jgi:hypothetical protein
MKFSHGKEPNAVQRTAAAQDSKQEVAITLIAVDQVKRTLRLCRRDGFKVTKPES